MAKSYRGRSGGAGASQRPGSNYAAGARRPDVIVDFIFEDGLFFISVANIGDAPALKVSVKFDKDIRGVDGSQVVSSLPLFRNIEFLAPQREIRTFLDSSTAYFGRREPTRIAAALSYRDQHKVKYATTIRHDLGIYKQIGYVRSLGSVPVPLADHHRRDGSHP